jgi:hypothetical protein
MAENDPSLPLGVPFIGGSDDPTEIVGSPNNDGEDTSTEDANPGI